MTRKNPGSRERACAAAITNRRILIVGVGSPYGPDTLGMDAVSQLQSMQSLALRDASFKQLDRPGPALLDEIRGAGIAIIIDAMQSGRPPGTVRRIGLGELLTQAKNVSAHEFGVAETMALGQALGDLPPAVVLIGVEAGQGHVPVPLDIEGLERLVHAVIESP